MGRIKDLEEMLEEQSKASKNQRNSIQLTSWKLDNVSKEKAALHAQLFQLKDKEMSFGQKIGGIYKRNWRRQSKKKRK